MQLSARIALLLCLFVFVAVRPAEATDCALATAEERVAGAEMVVIGLVAAVDDSVLIRSGNTISMPEKGIPHKLEIERVYKGEAGPSLTVYQRWIIGAPNLQVGDRWLLFLQRDQFGNLTAGPCAPSARLEPGTELAPTLLAALSEGRAPSGTVWGRQGQLVALGVAAIGASLYLLWRFRFRPM